ALAMRATGLQIRRVMRHLAQKIGVLGLLALLLSGCTKAPTVYLVKGTVKAVKAAEKTVTIAHEKIPDYMDAMTMDFEVKDAKELANVHPNDHVSFRMVVGEKDAWIENIIQLPSNSEQPTTKPVANAPDNFRR